MKYILWASGMLFCMALQAQKKTIDFAEYASWETFSERRLSSNGEWVSFGVSANDWSNPALYLRHLKTGKEQRFPNAKQGRFTTDSRIWSFQQGDTLAFIELQSGQLNLLPGMKELSFADSNSSVYSYYSAKRDTFFVKSLAGQVLRTIIKPLAARGKASGKAFVYLADNKLQYDDLATGESVIVAENITALQQFTWNTETGGFACVVERNKQPDIVWYDTGKKSTLLFSSLLKDSTWKMNLSSKLQFCGGRFFFTMNHADSVPAQPVADMAKVEIWSTADERIYPAQKKDLQRDLLAQCQFVFYPESRQVVQLSKDPSEDLKLPAVKTATHALLVASLGYRHLLQWDPVARHDFYVVDLASGNRTLVAKNIGGEASLSPAGKYVTWFDRDRQQYHSWNIATSVNTVIGKGITDPLAEKEAFLPQPAESFGIAAWKKEDAALLFNTAYDVWEADPAGKMPATCLTDGYGRKNNIRLSFYAPLNTEAAYQTGDTLLFIAENTNKTESGFFAVMPGTPRKWEKKIYGNYAFAFPGMDIASDRSLVLSFGNTSFYGFFHTRDMLHFDTLYVLNKQMQQKHNWYTSEVVEWQWQGKAQRGVLYKPENFNPQVKYPMITFIYEDYGNINTYVNPNWSASFIDFAHYTSNGYLVFVPRVRYTTGKPGESALQTMLSAIDHLAKNKWLDTARLGLQGHSWGGYEAAYIATRTNRFKAIAAGATVSDMISAYGSLRTNLGESRQWIYEKNQSRIGASLWENQAAYISNSPLFAADRIRTPLLLMHNEKDGIVPFAQSIEFYSALKRLNKKAWLLNYPEENHVLSNPKNKKDFTMRLYGFFEHYLKGRPAPQWMNGMPAKWEGRVKGWL
ncbi:alpha/beta hydrolase family protein [Sediminibacterium ginsengisoli]|uniref:Dipeptidyl aminopeptidase/acylaminoacyl peptidase n=1 Tax=Sediminibacterium ginsengisoli TaxID=413434 RepID=A0A1T4RFV9_9BACT|nr:prolyl oligopeptidase family serine peptidase [Sediminibacterium ginsengisoli]SKA14865.1 Dipeptidyl aminopeptidase/acylaminoacyl peptidase [Sediminibacterium ginsengisoli]